MNQPIFKFLYPYFLLSRVIVTFLDTINKLPLHHDSFRVTCYLTVLLWGGFFFCLNKNMEEILFSKILGTASLNKLYILHISFCLIDKENTLKRNVIKPYIKL